MSIKDARGRPRAELFSKLTDRNTGDTYTPVSQVGGKTTYRINGGDETVRSRYGTAEMITSQRQYENILATPSRKR